MSFVLSDLVIYLKFLYVLLVSDFLQLLEILLEISMETLLLNITVIVIEFISISCIIVYIVVVIYMVKEVKLQCEINTLGSIVYSLGSRI